MTSFFPFPSLIRSLDGSVCGCLICFVFLYLYLYSCVTVTFTRYNELPSRNLTNEKGMVL